MNWVPVATLLACGAGGAFLFHLLRVPMWPIVGSIVGAAAARLLLVGDATLPASLSPTAQVLVGAAIGASIAPSIFRHFARFLVPGTISVVLVIGIGLGLGLTMHLLGLLPLTEAVLGMVPGGVGEMVATAVSLGVDSAVVAGIHLVRLLVVLWTLPLLVRFARYLRRRHP